MCNDTFLHIGSSLLAPTVYSAVIHIRKCEAIKLAVCGPYSAELCVQCNVTREVGKSSSYSEHVIRYSNGWNVYSLMFDVKCSFNS